MKKFYLLIVAIFPVFLATACHQGGHHSAYAGQENQAIKALSDEDVQSYLNGEGMGLAKAAELNGFPGPKHILEIKDKLNLTPEQESAVQNSFEQMKSEAVSLGKKIVEKEKELDKLFSDNGISSEVVATKTREISELQGNLRNVHLRAHLEMKKTLSSEQIDIYKKTRGYTN